MFFGSFITIDSITNIIQSLPKSQPNNRKEPVSFNRQMPVVELTEIKKDAVALEMASIDTIDNNNVMSKNSNNSSNLGSGELQQQNHN